MLDKGIIQEKMDKVVDVFVGDIGSIRTGRANPALIEDVLVEAYEGQRMRIKELGSITAQDARTLVIQVWDQTVLGAVKNGLASANLGFNPAVDGGVIRISLPPLTAEQRQDYLKLLGKKLEGVKVMIRNIRAGERSGLQEAEKNKEISEDQFRLSEKELQELTDEYMSKLEEIAKKKEGEILGQEG
jgi:ribosome recycling factor